MILEKYFGATLEKSPYKWRTSRKKQIEKEIDITPFYRSPVSAVVHIPLDEKLLWGAILLIIIVLVFLNMRISQKQKSA